MGPILEITTKKYSVHVNFVHVQLNESSTCICTYNHDPLTIPISNGTNKQSNQISKLECIP